MVSGLSELIPQDGLNVLPVSGLPRNLFPVSIEYGELQPEHGESVPIRPQPLHLCQRCVTLGAECYVRLKSRSRIDVGYPQYVFVLSPYSCLNSSGVLVNEIGAARRASVDVSHVPEPHRLSVLDQLVPQRLEVRRRLRWALRLAVNHRPHPPRVA